MLHGGRRDKTRRLDSVALVVVRLLFASWSRWRKVEKKMKGEKERRGEEATFILCFRGKTLK